MQKVVNKKKYVKTIKLPTKLKKTFITGCDHCKRL